MPIVVSWLLTPLERIQCRRSGSIFVPPPRRGFQLSRRERGRKTLGPQRWRVKAAQVHRVRGKSPHQEPTDRTYWLIHAWQPDTGESKYLLSNAPPHTPPAVLMKAAFSRARIEHCFRIAKDELGLSHFEGRSYVALMRHLTLCQLLMLFLAQQSDLLRGEKSTGDGGADGPCPAGDLCTVASTPTTPK